MIDARFGNVNVIARDWRGLAKFYERVFGCVFVPPEREYKGADLSAGTGVPDAALRGAHLRLPGGGPAGPTLEIYQYDPSLESLPSAANRPGFGLIEVVVPDVTTALDAVVAEGRGVVSGSVTLQTADGRCVTCVYVTDRRATSWSCRAGRRAEIAACRGGQSVAARERLRSSATQSSRRRTAAAVPRLKAASTRAVGRRRRDGRCGCPARAWAASQS